MGSERIDGALKCLTERLLEEFGRSAESFVRHDVTLKLAHGFRCIDIQGWLWLLDRDYLVLRASVNRTGVGVGAGEFLLALDVQDAITLAGQFMDTEPIQLTRHREERMIEWHDGSFRELGEFLFRRFEQALRNLLGPYVRMSYAAHGHIRPGFDARDVLGAGDKAIYDCVLSIQGYPDSPACVALDQATALEWNSGRPLFCDAARSSRVGRSTSKGKRGELVGFLDSDPVIRAVQDSADRLGFAVVLAERDEMPDRLAEPNPVVVVEVPIDGHKALATAAAVKQKGRQAVVILLLHRPTRERVIQAFQTRADATIGWPSTEQQISARIEAAISAAQMKDRCLPRS